ncbi:hypothetical protein [Saccharopolyspora phatthalungensis]|uniref:Signal recognition particle receptor subunit beta n=1 Tax=Saccharopolyspora phatthalungensis TaxID=664693 RepID=A0A840Q413_9PSEU|nr:hypothetical protein [Saccharopolyspora phatthalungensis]MBB5155274.1 signal recognition particle receptor subunit beta [Saccharopolyspora phatthalungensis]
MSEIVPLTTAAVMTEASNGIDGVRATPNRSTMTIAMYFGRLLLASDLVLYLVRRPGASSAPGSCGTTWSAARSATMLLVDTLRLADCVSAIDLVRECRLP